MVRPGAGSPHGVPLSLVTTHPRSPRPLLAFHSTYRSHLHCRLRCAPLRTTHRIIRVALMLPSSFLASSSHHLLRSSPQAASKAADTSAALPASTGAMLFEIKEWDTVVSWSFGSGPNEHGTGQCQICRRMLNETSTQYE